MTIPFRVPAGESRWHRLRRVHTAWEDSGDDSDILWRRSTDGGVTWSAFRSCSSALERGEHAAHLSSVGRMFDIARRFGRVRRSPLTGSCVGFSMSRHLIEGRQSGERRAIDARKEPFMSARLANGFWFHPSPQPAIGSWRMAVSSGSLATVLDGEGGKPITSDLSSSPTFDRADRSKVLPVRRALSFERWRRD
jgi:hypothetical protein